MLGFVSLEKNIQANSNLFKQFGLFPNYSAQPVDIIILIMYIPSPFQS